MYTRHKYIYKYIYRGAAVGCITYYVPKRYIGRRRGGRVEERDSIRAIIFSPHRVPIETLMITTIIRFNWPGTPNIRIVRNGRNTTRNIYLLGFSFLIFTIIYPSFYTLLCNFIPKNTSMYTLYFFTFQIYFIPYRWRLCYIIIIFVNSLTTVFTGADTFANNNNFLLFHFRHRIKTRNYNMKNNKIITNSYLFVYPGNVHSTVRNYSL